MDLWIAHHRLGLRFAPLCASAFSRIFSLDHWFICTFTLDTPLCLASRTPRLRSHTRCTVTPGCTVPHVARTLSRTLVRGCALTRFCGSGCYLFYGSDLITHTRTLSSFTFFICAHVVLRLRFAHGCVFIVCIRVAHSSLDGSRSSGSLVHSSLFLSHNGSRLRIALRLVLRSLDGSFVHSRFCIVTSLALFHSFTLVHRLDRGWISFWFSHLCTVCARAASDHCTHRLLHSFRILFARTHASFWITLVLSLCGCHHASFIFLGSWITFTPHGSHLVYSLVARILDGSFAHWFMVLVCTRFRSRIT